MFSEETKVGKIVLLLFKKHIKSSNKLISFNACNNLLWLLSLFTKRNEDDLIIVVFKLLANRVSEPCPEIVYE